MEKVVYSAFTSTPHKLANKLLSEIKLINNKQLLNGIGQWDTGATCTCISEKVVKDLGLLPTGKSKIGTPSGEKIVGTYLIDLILPNQVMIKDLKVLETDIGRQGIEVLLGMDIILNGDFAVSNYQKSTVISFVIPSMKKIDFIPDAKAKNFINMKKK